MQTYLALIRGINVGNNALKMDRLREIWQGMGFTKIRTYVQSGNIVFDGKKPSEKAIENRLARETRLPVMVIIKSREELKAIVGANPFLRGKSVDHSKLHVTFLQSAPVLDAIEKLKTINAVGDAYHIDHSHVYLHCPGGYGRTKLSNNALERLLAVRATTRNWNTVLKLGEMLNVGGKC